MRLPSLDDVPQESRCFSACHAIKKYSELLTLDRNQEEGDKVTITDVWSEGTPIIQQADEYILLQYLENRNQYKFKPKGKPVQEEPCIWGPSEDVEDRENPSFINSYARNLHAVRAFLKLDPCGVLEGACQCEQDRGFCFELPRLVRL